jgi:hypothetical protein
MATPRLTAQQKRDREYMTATATLIADHEQKLTEWGNQNYGQGYKEAENDVCYGFYKSPWYYRLFYPHYYKKALEN